MIMMIQMYTYMIYIVQNNNVYNMYNNAYVLLIFDDSLTCINWVLTHHRHNARQDAHLSPLLCAGTTVVRPTGRQHPRGGEVQSVLKAGQQRDWLIMGIPVCLFFRNQQRLPFFLLTLWCHQTWLDGKSPISMEGFS